MPDLNALADALLEARDAKASAEDALKAANAAVESADATLFEALADAGLSKISAHGYSFSPDVKEYYRVGAANMDAFHEVMEEIGRGGIFRLTAAAQTINATLRELADESEAGLPESLKGLVEVYSKQKCNVRKAARS